MFSLQLNLRVQGSVSHFVAFNGFVGCLESPQQLSGVASSTVSAGNHEAGASLSLRKETCADVHNWVDIVPYFCRSHNLYLQQIYCNCKK